jgi:hypothetical protein
MDFAVNFLVADLLIKGIGGFFTPSGAFFGAMVQSKMTACQNFS